MTPKRRHMMAALGAAVLLHVGAAVALGWRAPAPGAAATGMGGISIALGPAGAAAGAIPRQVAAVPDAAPESQPGPESERPAEPRPLVETEPVPELPPAAAEAVPIETPDPPETVPPAAPAPEIVPKNMVAKPTPTPRERLAHVRPPERRPESPEPPTTSVSRLKKTAEEPPEQPQNKVAENQTHAAEASAAGHQGTAGNAQSGDVGNGANRSGGGIAGARSGYLSRLRAWLERHKAYPRRAQLRHQEGTALLHLSLDRSGRVLTYRLHRSAGHESLDHEVLEMVKRAQPLPRMPEDMPQERLDLVVPVQFVLK